MSNINSSIIFETFESTDTDVPGLRIQYKDLNVHGFQTLKCLDAMRKERQLCDVILMVEDHEIFAHRALLSCHSNYFRELFLNDDNDTTKTKQMYYQIDGIEYLAIKLIIQFIYRGSFVLTTELVPKIYLAAHQLRIEALFKACSNYLCEQLSDNNCLSARLLAMDEDLRTKTNEYIQNNFTTILETRECRTLPAIKIELIDTKALKPKIICDLVINWIAQQLCKENISLQGLCECMHLLYLSGETFHDCANMDDKNIHFSDLVKDYQSYKLTKRSLSSTSSSSIQNEMFFLETTNLQVISTNVLSNTVLNSHVPETKLIHMTQANDYNYIVIAIIKGKMVIISIHMTSSSPSPTTPENNVAMFSDKTFESNHVHAASPILTSEKDIIFGPLSTARCCFGIVSDNDTIYVVGGYNRSDCLDTIEQFDSIENRWILLSSSMSSRRGRVSAAIVNGKIYVCGGSDGQRELNTAECFDLNNKHKWSIISGLSMPVAHSAMCSDENYVYLIGGMEGDKCKSDCYRYDPNDNSWSQLASMNIERSETSVVYFNGKIYVFGGSTLSRCLSSCEILTLSTNEWQMGPSMKENRRGCSAVLYHNKIFVIGGSNGVASLTSIEVFDPVTNEWLMSLNGVYGELNIPRVGLGATVCCDKIYVIGGFDGRTFLKSIEVYDEQFQWRLSYHNTNQLDKNS